MVDSDMMEQQDPHPTPARRLFTDGQVQQRCLLQIEAVVRRREALQQLRRQRSVARVEPECLDLQPRMTPDHLQRCLKPFPGDRCTQHIVALYHTLQCLDEVVQTAAAVEAELRLQYIGVTFTGGQVMEQDALLQRRQRIDILHVRCTARHVRHHPVDLLLGQADQRQQLWGDVLTILGNQIGRYLDFATATDCRCQRRQGRLTEQHTDIGAQTGLTHPLDQRDGQQ